MSGPDDLFAGTEPPKPEEPFVPPALPDAVYIPEDLVRRWLAMAPEAVVEVPLSRQDLDLLFASINQLNMSVISMQNLMVDFTNGRMNEANIGLSQSRQATAHAANALRGLYTSLMSKAVGSTMGETP